MRGKLALLASLLFTGCEARPVHDVDRIVSLSKSQDPLGATLTPQGAVFRVWAPHASAVSVNLGGALSPLSLEGANGVFSGQVGGAKSGDPYSFVVTGPQGVLARLDPYGRALDPSGKSNILVDPLAYRWPNSSFTPPPLPLAVIYELHVGSFSPEHNETWGTYNSVAEKLDHLAHLGVNYVELLPTQHSARPFDWGYGVSLPNTLEQSYGSPDELRNLVSAAHDRGIGVLIDIVQNHYSRASALTCFDGDCPTTRAFGNYFYPGLNGMTEWGPRPNFSKREVRDLIRDSVARYLNEYHVDGFRWDAAPYITRYYDYDSARHAQVQNGDNSDGISLMREMNDLTHKNMGTLSIAEYFGAPASATRPTQDGGLGFDAHWAGLFPVVEAITATDPATIDLNTVSAAIENAEPRVIYTESHDEVGHPPRQIRIPTRIDPARPGSLLARKRSLLGATLLFTSPGTPMLFQGQEILEDQSFAFPTGTPVDWAKANTYSGILSAYHHLISLRKNEDGSTPALLTSKARVFHENNSAKVLAFMRGKENSSQVVVLANLGPRSFVHYRIGLPHPGRWTVKFTSDDSAYSSDFSNRPLLRELTAQALPYDALPASADIDLAPYTVVLLCPLQAPLSWR